MSEQTVRGGRPPLPWKRACVAAGAGLAALSALLLLFAALGAEWIVPQGREGVAAHAALLLAALLTGALSCEKGGGIGAGALIAAGMLLFAMLLLGIFTKASSVFNISMLANVLCVIFGVFSGCALRSRRPARRRRRRR